jgi:RNA polymerase sigma-70 factor (ECF subfamily)
MESQKDCHFRAWAELDEDTLLMIRAAEGDKAAFERLYKKCLPIVTTYLTSLNGCDTAVEDLVQEVFTRLWENRGRFRGDSCVKTYILSIAKNVLADYQRGLCKQTLTVDSQYLEGTILRPSRLSGADVELRRAETKNAVEQAIAKLTAKQREAVKLFYFQGTDSLGVGAKRANCSTEAFRGCLRRARAALRRILRNLEPWESLS